MPCNGVRIAPTNTTKIGHFMSVVIFFKLSFHMA